MRYLVWLPLAAGLGLLVWLLQDMDVRGMAEAVVHVGWPGLLLLPLAFSWLVPNAIAWEYSFKAPGSGVPFHRLLMVRIAGESLNDLLPSSNLGGEPVKVLLLRPQVTLPAAMSSVMVAKTTQTLSIVIFILGGLGATAWETALPTEVIVTAGGVLAMLGGGSVVLVLGAHSGLLGRFARYGVRRFPRADWLIGLANQAAALDACLSGFYATEKRRFAASTLWHLFGLIAGSAEVYFIAWLLGLPLTVSGALTMEVVTTLFGVGGFAIPGSIGAFEFGHVVSASMLGLPAASGMAMSLIRRLREVFWLLAGLGILWVRVPGVWRGIELDGGDVGVREGR